MYNEKKVIVDKKINNVKYGRPFFLNRRRIVQVLQMRVLYAYVYISKTNESRAARQREYYTYSKHNLEIFYCFHLCTDTRASLSRLN